MDIKLQGGVSLPPTLPSAKEAAPVIKRPSSDAGPMPIAGSGAEGGGEQQRLERVQRAASMLQETYAVSDTSFSIYKDGTGQYITRFVNLRDGKVTYIPEPDPLADMNRRRAEMKASFDVLA
jgi:hypothetical protein